MKNKKAMVTTSLSWMIMTIIGAFFIIFGYSIIQNYQDIEEEKFSLELQSTLNHIFTLIGQSTGSEANSLQKLNTIFQDRRVEMFCREGIPTLSIDGDENPNAQFLKNYPVFMTEIDQEKADLSYVAVENFDMPFRITPLLGIVSKKNLYVIDESNEELVEIYREKFNRYSAFNELNVKFVDLSQQSNVQTLLDEVEDQNLNSISFLTNTQYREDYLEGFLDEISYYGTHIQIDYNEFTIDEQTHAEGTIFYVASTKDNFEKKNFSYIDWNKQLSLPTMALFSKPEVFECSYSILKEAINQTYLYYEIKAKELQEISTNKQHCRDDISKPEQKIKYSTIENELYNARFDETFINLKNYNYLDSLINKHNNIIRDSCIYLY